MLRSFQFFLVLLFSIQVSAGEVQQAAVSHKDGVYTLELDVVVRSAYEAVYAIVTDYDQLHLISEMLVETSLLSEAEAEIKRRKLVTRTCILIFCFTAVMIEDVWETDNTINTKIIPEDSDYKYGMTTWTVDAVDDQSSRIKLYCELQPDFWIPPFVGPYLMKKTMLREAKKTVLRIEELTSNG